MKKIMIVALVALFLCSCAVSTSVAEATMLTTTPATTVTETTTATTQSVEKEPTLTVYNTSDLNDGITGENFSIYNKHNANAPGVCCYIEATDTFFFSINNNIYQKNGDTTIPLIDMRATNLNFIDGWLYFSTPQKYIDDFTPVGPVYRYCPKTGELVKVFDGNVRYMAYNGENLIMRIVNEVRHEVKTYISDDGTENEFIALAYDESYYECDLNGNIIREITCDRIFGVDVGKMLVAEVENNKTVYNLYMNNEKITLPLKGAIDIVSFCGDYIYCYLNGDLCRYNITEGKEEVLKVRGYMSDYTFMDGKIYYITETLIHNVAEDFSQSCSKTITAKEMFFLLYAYNGELYMQNGLKLLLAEYKNNTYIPEEVKIQ